jgi:hypothetical protein
MPRIFACLAFANLLLLTASGAVGIFAPRWGVDRHVLLAVLTLIFSSFVQVVTFTYLTVTGKIIGQAVHLGGLEASIHDRVKSYKRGATRCLAAVFGAMVFVTATGAAGWRSGGATVWHDVAVGLVLVVHGGVFWREYEIMFLNSRLVERTLGEYEQARKERKTEPRP